LGIVYAQEDKLEKAIVEYPRTLTIAPSLQPVHLNLPILCFKQEAYANVVKPLRKFLAWQPQNRQARHLLGLCYLEPDQYEAALQTLSRLRAEHDPSILLALAAAYIRLDRSLQGEDLIRELLTSEPDSARIHFMLAQTYFSLGQFPQSLTEFERVYALEPAWPQIHMFLGVTTAQFGRFDEAENELRAELKIDPASFLANFTLGALLNLNPA
jgi:tetratricopeptide (TPR) repeat protein